MSRQSKSERQETIKQFRESINHGGGLRIHLIHSRSNMTTTARMWHPDGYALATARGCGYARGGVALGKALTLLFPEEIKELGEEKRQHPATFLSLHGLVVRDGVAPYLEGAAGIQEMLRVLRDLGYRHTECFETGERSQMVLALREVGK